AYREEEVRGEKRVVLGFHPRLAPVKVAILPLSGKLEQPAHKVYEAVCTRFVTDYDDAGSIGRRYRRQDEAGTPYCVTFDFESLNDRAVTIRERDSMIQQRIPIEELVAHLAEKLGAEA
ncbi:MAG: glycine--tRNA ligase, partial [Candidatus Lambdaproteobacteria bacterium]|nr:glycine--tRNA ligase [Candidatus Lambdaproteobacteria bacterium]